MSEGYGPDPALDLSVFNPQSFSYLNGPVSYATLLANFQSNVAGTDTIVRTREINTEGIVLQGALQMENNASIVPSAAGGIVFDPSHKWDATGIQAPVVKQGDLDLGFEVNTTKSSLNEYKTSNDYVVASVQNDLSVAQESLSQQIFDASAAASVEVFQARIDLQSQIDTSIGSVTQTVSALAGGVESASANVLTNLSSTTQTLSASISNLQTSLSATINENYDDQAARMTQIESSVQLNKAAADMSFANLHADVTAVQEGLASAQTDLAARATTSYVDAQVSSLVNGSASMLATLQQLSAEVQADNNATSTLLTMVNAKANQTDLAALQTVVDGKASLDSVTSLIADLQSSKVNVLDFESAVGTLNNDLSLLPTQQYLDAQLSAKVDATTHASDIAALQNELLAKANSTTLVSELTGKLDASVYTADKSALNTQLAGFVTSSTLTTGLAGKVNVSDYNTNNSLINGTLATKVSNSDFVAAQQTLATKSEVNNLNTSITYQLGTKASSTALTTGLAGKVDTSTYTTDLSGIAVELASKASVSYVDSAVSALVGAAPSTLDTLQELASALADGESAVASLTTSIAAKANDDAVMHLTGNETATGTKTFDAVSVASLNGLSSTTLSHLSGLTSNVQTQIDAIAAPDLSSYLTTTNAASTYQPIGSYLTTATAASTYQPIGSYLTTTNAASTYQPIGSYLTTTSAASTYQPIGSYLTTANAASTYQTVAGMSGYAALASSNTFTGTNTFGQNIVSRTVERVQSPTLSTSTITFDYAQGAIGYVTPNSTTNMTLNVSNLPVTGANANVSAVSFTLLLNTTTNKAYVNTLTVNGSAATINFVGGSSAISLTGANYVIQTFTVCSLPGDSTNLRCLSSVAPCS